MNYTQITARVIDQRLEMINIPPLVSGSVDIYQIVAQFCELWADMNKTAVFSRNPTPHLKTLTVIPKPMVDDTVIIPPEMLLDEGYFFVSIVGTNGTQTRPTEVVKMTVSKGAITSATSIFDEPTPDVYAQLLVMCTDANKTAQSVRDEFDSGVVPALKDLNSYRGVRFWLGMNAQYLEQEASLPDGTLCAILDDTLLPEMLAAIEQLKADVAALQAAAGS